MTHDSDAKLFQALQPLTRAAGTVPGARQGSPCLPFRTLQDLLSEAAPAAPSPNWSEEDRERYSVFTRHCLSRLNTVILDPDLPEVVRFERCVRHVVDYLLREGLTLETIPDPHRAAEGVSVYAFYYLLLSLFLDHPSPTGPPLTPIRQVERAFAWCTAVLRGKRWRLSRRV